MAFVKKDWKDRIAEFINRRRLTYEDGRTELVEVARDEGTVSQEGDAFTAETMNDLEERVAAGIKGVEDDLANYLPLTGGTLTGETLLIVDGNVNFVVKNKKGTVGGVLAASESNGCFGLYDLIHEKWLIYANQNGVVYSSGTADRFGNPWTVGSSVGMRAPVGTAKGNLFMQVDYDAMLMYFGIDGHGSNALSVNKARCDASGNVIKDTYLSKSAITVSGTKLTINLD